MLIYTWVKKTKDGTKLRCPFKGKKQVDLST